MSTTTAVLPGTWEMVIGLEVHCELQTATKLFCSCRNEFGAEPNTNVCPVCLGLPGSLPVINRQAVEFAMRIGQALHCEVRPSIFHRKNYFYPDMPKDYQVSQYDEPINVDGWLELPDGTRIGIERAHMEEDTGKTTHVSASGRIHGAEYSLVDYNRAGVPLVEIVGRPDIRSSEHARQYVAELRSILLAVGASDARMEEGSLRVDANVSVRQGPDAPLGTRCEIKNMNSLRSLGRAIEWEARRQVGLLEAGERIVQETRHWNEGEGRTHSLRSKEEAMDYRYFPEPDLVPLAPADEWIADVRAALPALPAERRATLAAAAGVQPAEVALVVEKGLDELVLSAVEAGAEARVALVHAEQNVSPDAPIPAVPQFARLVTMQVDALLTPTQAKQVLAEMQATGRGPDDIAEERGFEAMAADSLATAVDEAIAQNPDEAARLKGGEQKLVGFFVGKVMAATGGKANGKEVTALLRDRLGL
jgi:aspartyl-tRNA(Asn)/glutamyl-tRNA(Gln) amidotransferase subunit B